MKLGTVFAEFDRLADTANAVAKMRVLILDLAMKGRLARQDSKDGDAGELLDVIAAARHTREPCDGGAPPETDGWYDIPPSWRWVRLGSLGAIVGGGTPRSENSSYFAEHGIPWLTPADLNGFKGKRIRRGRRFLTQQGLDNSSAQLLPEGSVLFSSRAPIGYVAIAGAELATNQGFKSCVPYIKETNEFLYYFLMSAASRIDSEASGTTFREVSGKIVGQIPVPLPPLAEQRRIVARVDELMALCDLLEAQQQERDARHAALAQASQARFADAPTPANLEFLFNSAYSIAPVDLRKSILGLAIDGFLGERLEAGEWPTVPMKEVCLQITDGEHATPSRVSSGVPLATAKNVRDGFLQLTNTDFVAQSTAEKCWKRCKPRNQDLLMVCVGATTGRVCLAVNPPDMVLVRSVALIRPNPARIDPRFLDLFLRSPSGQTQVWRGVKQSAQPCLYLGKMAEFEIKLPPLAEQRRIVTAVRKLLALVDQLEEQLSASQATGERLIEAIVAELTDLRAA